MTDTQTLLSNPAFSPIHDPKIQSLPRTVRLILCRLAIMHRTTGIQTSHLLIEDPLQAPLQANHRLAGLEVPDE